MEDVKQVLQKAVKELFAIDQDLEINRPDPQFGDFATNAPLKLAGQLQQNPREIAEKIASYLNQNKPDWLDSIEIAGPGFVNFRLSDNFWFGHISQAINQANSFGKSENLKGKVVLVEFLDPNPFKEIHIGHAYSGTVGDCIASLFEAAGATVHRVTYQGDVGLNAAKAVYGILHKISHDISKLKDIPEAERPKFLSETYVFGAKSYSEDEAAKQEIDQINQLIYGKIDPIVNEVWSIGRQWSLDYFKDVYKQFGFTSFDKNYMESMVSEEGVKIVNEHLKDGVFERSDGAIIFRGEKYGLHTRVFINSLGLPTYEAKDLGNAMLKERDWNYDKSIIITGNEQSEYFKVMLKALEQFEPEKAKATTHIPHGLVKLSIGKMSSRTGNVVKALDVLQKTKEMAKKLAQNKAAPIQENSIAAIKYAFLKNRIGGDIIYDVEESLSLEGNSGPYIQYAHARARSILAKANTYKLSANFSFSIWERSLAVKIAEFPEVVQKATEELMPHHICTYLFELAQVFNRFYENERVIGSDQESFRLALVSAYAGVLNSGLKVLNIPAPERM